MSVFVDTNILLRSVQPSHPLHEAAVSSVAAFIAQGTPLMVTPQIVAEFWNVATRPTENNGLGMPHEQAREELARLEAFFVLLSESPEVYAEWKRLVLAYGVTGVKVHDARLVAAMNVYGIRRILTFNKDDFRRYRDIEIITPA
jgi:predicted nucleic acid-binding protein